MEIIYTIFKPLASILFVVILVVAAWFIFNWFSSPEFEISALKNGIIINLDTGKSEVAAEKDSITVVSYNLGFAAGPMQETLADDHPISFYEQNLDDFISMIKFKDADVVLLQEIDLDSKRSGYVDQLDYVMSRLGWSYAAPVVDWDLYFPLRKEHKIVKATVILSKFPIISNDYVLTSCKPNFDSKLLNIFYYPLLWKSTMQRVNILVGERNVSFYNVHMCVWNRDARVAQAKYLSEWINNENDTDNFIIAGDFNFQAYIRGTPLPAKDMAKPPFMGILWSDVPEIAELFISKDTDTATIHKKITFPERKHRYDFMFYSKGLDLLKADIDQDIQSSDHLPLIGKFRISN